MNGPVRESTLQEELESLAKELNLSPAIMQRIFRKLDNEYVPKSKMQEILDHEKAACEARIADAECAFESKCRGYQERNRYLVEAVAAMSKAFLNGWGG